MSAQLDVEQPMLGLTALQVQGQPTAGSLLGIGVEAETSGAGTSSLAWSPADVYVRGCDLVATYREPLGEQFNLQIYWRVLEGRDEQIAVVDAIVSIQTPLWEAYPCVTSSSALPCGDALVQDDSVAIKLEGGNWYVEATCRGDFSLSHVRSADGTTALNWRFGRQFMERGVIRRLHLRGAFAREMNVSAMHRLRESLATEPPPLTV